MDAVNKVLKFNLYIEPFGHWMWKENHMLDVWMDVQENWIDSSMQTPSTPSLAVACLVPYFSFPKLATMVLHQVHKAVHSFGELGGQLR